MKTRMAEPGRADRADRAGIEATEPLHEATGADEVARFEIARVDAGGGRRVRMVARAAVLALTASMVLAVAAAQLLSPGSRPIHSSAQRASGLQSPVPRASAPAVVSEP